jgi:glycosyltransferase involved in cell wall biosynthesis
MPVTHPDAEFILSAPAVPVVRPAAVGVTLRPRVLFLVNSLVTGGAERQAVSLLNSLDCETFHLSLGYLKPDTALLPQLKRERLEDLLSLDVRHKLDLRALRELTRHIDARKIDVVVSTNQYSALYAMLAGRRAKNPPQQMEVFHTTIPQSLKESAQMLVYRALFRRLDLLVYVSQLQRQYWAARGLRARRELVIHNGINTDHFTDTFTAQQKRELRERSGFGESDYLIGICAALRPEKAHGDFLQALAALRSAGQPAKGLIIGDGPQRSVIERRIGELDLTRHVLITGLQRDVRPFLAACDVMTLTSHAVETFSLAALESMSMGKPVILSEVGGAAEQVSQGVNGFLFAPGDIAALLSALTKLTSVQLRAQMAVAGAARVRAQFTEAAMTCAYATQLQSLAAAHRRDG